MGNLTLFHLFYASSWPLKTHVEEHKVALNSFYSYVEKQTLFNKNENVALGYFPT